jgi:hypothetical protein
MPKREVTGGQMNELAEAAAFAGAATAFRLMAMLAQLQHPGGIRAILCSEDLQDAIADLIGKSTATMATSEIDDDQDAAARIMELLNNAMALLPPALASGGPAPQMARA